MSSTHGTHTEEVAHVSLLVYTVEKGRRFVTFRDACATSSGTHGRLGFKNGYHGNIL